MLPRAMHRTASRWATAQKVAQASNLGHSAYKRRLSQDSTVTTSSLSADTSSDACTSNALVPPQQPSFFSGVFPVMAAPFLPDATESESLDLDGFRAAIKFMAKAGCQGVTVCGIGESDRMTDAERELLVGAAVEAAREASSSSPSGAANPSNSNPSSSSSSRQSSQRKAKGDRSPGPFRVCVDTSSHAGTAATALLSKMAMDLGADAVMVAPSAGKGPSGTQTDDDDTIAELYEGVARQCPGLPIVLQDSPASTGAPMSARLIARIIADVPTVQCVTIESLPTPPKIAELKRIWSDDPHLAQPPGACTILTGLGGLYGGFDLERETDGFMTGFAFPEILLAMHRAARVGDYHRAHAIYARYLPLIVFEQQPGAAVRKEVYKRRGIVGSPASLCSIDPILEEALDGQLKRSFGSDIDITKPLPPQILIPLPDERSRARQLSSIWYR